MDFFLIEILHLILLIYIPSPLRQISGKFGSWKARQVRIFVFYLPILETSPARVHLSNISLIKQGNERY
jgi:hypothetical protein